MIQFDSLGKWIIAFGLAIAAAGALMLLLGRIPGLDRFGSLPGDIRYQSADGRFSCFVPIVSTILLSIVLTIVLNVVLRILRR